MCALMPKRPLVDIETGTPRAPVYNGVPPREPLDEEALGWHEKQVGRMYRDGVGHGHESGRFCK